MREDDIQIVTGDRLKDLRIREAELKASLSDIRKRILEEMYKNTGVRPGDIVIAERTQWTGCEVLVEKLDMPDLHDQKFQWVSGRPKLKDGAWGNRQVHLFGQWRKP